MEEPLIKHLSRLIQTDVETTRLVLSDTLSVPVPNSAHFVTPDFFSQSILANKRLDEEKFRPKFLEQARRAAHEHRQRQAPSPAKSSLHDTAPCPVEPLAEIKADTIVEDLDYKPCAEELQCVVERYGARFVAVRGALPKYTGGRSGIPWGKHCVWSEPYSTSKAHKALEKLRSFWYRTAGTESVSPTHNSRRRSALSGLRDGHPTPGATHVESPPPKESRNGICLHVACSKKAFCIVRILAAMKTAYLEGKDYFQIRAIDKALAQLVMLQSPLITDEDVDATQLGKKSKEKVKEILHSGHLSRVTAAAGDERHKSLESLMEIWGVAAATAEKWYVQFGLKSPADVRAKHEQDPIAFKLTEQQRCGLTHFEDFKRKIPRPEVALAESIVRSTIFDLLEERGLSTAEVARTYAFATGSYIRGAAESSDIDMLVILPPVASDVDVGAFLQQLLSRLLHQGLLLDEMSPQTAGRHSVKRASFLGVARPPTSPCPRRIDFKLYAPEHLPCAVNYFSNSEAVCRATRYWAAHAESAKEVACKLHPQANGFKLSDQTLVCRRSTHSPRPKGGNSHSADSETEEELDTGLQIDSETKLFQVLGLEYIPPHMRTFNL